jgi:hypothetical protein
MGERPPVVLKRGLGKDGNPNFFTINSTRRTTSGGLTSSG